MRSRSCRNKVCEYVAEKASTWYVASDALQSCSQRHIARLLVDRQAAVQESHVFDKPTDK